MNNFKAFIAGIVTVGAVFTGSLTCYAATGNGAIKYINEYRQQCGLTTLRADSSLKACADIRSREISELMSHTRPDGTDYWTAGAGDSYGETLCRQTPDTDESVVEAWIESPTHRQILSNAGYTKCAISVFEKDGHEYIAAEFA